MGTWHEPQRQAGSPGVQESMPLVGTPDGPARFIPEFGFEVGTFTQERKDLYKKKDSGSSSLMHHVPRDKRGFYKPFQTADFDDTEFEYLTDEKGYALCTATTKAGTPCRRKAVNMSWVCIAHGGKLHPLDKVVSDYRDGMEDKEGRLGGAGRSLDPELVSRMTRYQKLVQGIISVDELDDEELARGQCRNPDGNFAPNPPKMIPKAIHDRMVQQLFERANEAFKVALIPAVETLGEIAKGDAFEPADRIKAASLIVDRVMGKNADVVVHKQDQPWELALSTITGGSRAESRVARGLDPDTGEPAEQLAIGQAEDVIDAEVVETTEEKRQRLMAELDRLDAEDDERCTSQCSEGHTFEPGCQLHVSRPGDSGDDGDDMGVGPSDLEVPDDDDWPEEVHDADSDDWSSKPGEEAAYGRPDSGGVEKSPQEKADEAASLRDRLKSSRRQRYAARARGLDTVTETPYRIIKKGANPDGEGYLVALKMMTTPGKKRDDREYRHRI